MPTKKKKEISKPAEPQAEQPKPANRTVHYEGWLVLRTPLQHGADINLGTTRLFRSQKMVGTGGEVNRIPVYSGNAIRGMLRDIAGFQLLEALGIQVPPHVFDFLTSGGSLTQKGTTVDLGLARRLRERIPMIGLFGGGVGNQIIEGKTIFLQGTPICQETIHLLPRYCREAPSAKLCIRDLRQIEYATRRDDKKKESSQKHIEGPIPERAEGDVATQMKFETETIAPGTCLRFGFVAEGVTESEWRTLCMALIGFLKRPFLGGRAAAGYGEVAIPDLYRAQRRIEFGQEVELDTDQPLATIQSEVNTEDRLAFTMEQIAQEYFLDVSERKEEIQSALAEVV